MWGDSTLLWHLAGAASFSLHDATAWQWYHYALWMGLMALALEVLATLVLRVGPWAQPSVITDTAPPLTELSSIDHAYITVNKLTTALFTYHVIRYAWHSDTVEWDLRALSPLNSAVALVALYVMYDMGYYWFHRSLHHQSVYRFVHKHHHRQNSPFRGNVDAINVHPFEFAVGEYNHLACIHAVALGLGAATGGRIHLVAIGLFIIVSGVLASLNHTRLDVRFPQYEVRYHDVHHAHGKRDSNYSQYTMLWDRVFGTFLSYEDAKQEREKKEGR
jgi:sterol desaturase/sphingolipid hydroxylase (fatty acid hydroxylase superfamily)